MSSNGSVPGTVPAAAPAGIALRRGHATAEELAALVAVLTAATGAEPSAPARPGSEWASRARGLRRPLTPGSGGWRRSAWPG